MEKRWSEDCVNWVKWVPWRRYKDAWDADGELPEGAPVEERASGSSDGNLGNSERVVFIETKNTPLKAWSRTCSTKVNARINEGTPLSKAA